MRTVRKNSFPLEHLSASSVNLLERDEKGWIDKYLYGHDEYSNEYMDFGRTIADFTDEDRLIECTLKRGKDTLKVIGLLDGYKRGTQFENKTAVKMWTQAMCDKSFQLKTYALIHFKNHGKIPNQELTCRETRKTENGLELTGEEKTFKVRHTIKDLLEAEVKYWRAYDKIIKLSANEISKL